MNLFGEAVGASVLEKKGNLLRSKFGLVTFQKLWICVDARAYFPEQQLQDAIRQKLNSALRMKGLRFEPQFDMAMYDIFGPEWDSGRIGEAIFNALVRYDRARKSIEQGSPRSILTIRVKNILLIVSVTELEHVYSIDHA